MILRRLGIIALLALISFPAFAQQQYDPGGKARVTVYGAPPSAGVVPPPVAVGTIIVTPTSTFNRPADTNAYAIGDLIANSVTAGSVVPLSFTAVRAAGGSGSILKATLKSSNTAVINDVFVLHLYGATPTPSNGDNGAFLTTTSSWICDITVTMNAYPFTDSVEGQGVPNTSNACNFVLASGSAVFGLLETRTVYTPASAETFTAQIEGIENN